LNVRVFNIDISDAVDEIIYDLSFDLELVLESVSEDVGRDEPIVCGVQRLELLVHPADDLQLVKLL
jgi:hypothetical protein